MESHLAALKERLRAIGPCLVAFSGGVDSTFLLRVAHDVLGDGVMAVTAVSPSLAAAEREEAIALARLIGAPHLLVDTHEIDDPDYVRNDGRRCYFCKRELFRVMREVARSHQGRVLLYGAIPDDLGDDRPGMKAAGESGVRAPLIEVGMSKVMIRALSRQLSLPTWDKPAMACLASRIPRDTPVSREALGRVERAEMALRSLGYRQVRVRHHGDRARIELDLTGLQEVGAPEARRLLIEAVLAAGFAEVVIDPRGYRPAAAAEPPPSAPS
jgi:uncharacterized protein